MSDDARPSVGEVWRQRKVWPDGTERLVEVVSLDRYGYRGQMTVHVQPVKGATGRFSTLEYGAFLRKFERVEENK